MRRLLILALLGILFSAASAQASPRPVYVVDQSATISADLLHLTVPVFQSAVNEDFAPYWGTDADLRLVSSLDAVPVGGWTIIVADDSDYFGALGYHEVSARGPPSASVFARTSVNLGYSWEVTFTHELFEMLADPFLGRTMWNARYRFWQLEVSDPVEADRYAYFRHDIFGNPVQISDFVTEAWYMAYADGPYDFTGHVTKPQQVLPGGYAAYWRVHFGWTIIDRFHARVRRE